MKNKKIFVLILSFIIAFTLPISVSASQWESEDFSVKVPDNLYTFTRETLPNDASWVLAGISNPNDILTLFKSKDDKGMNAVVNFIGNNGSPNIIITKNKSEESFEIFNFADLSEDEILEFSKTISVVPENFSSETEIVDFDGLRMIHVKYNSLEDYDGEQLSEHVYATIFNGNIVTIDLHSKGRDLKEDEIQTLEEIASSFKITKIVTREELENQNKLDAKEMLNLFIITIALIVVIIASVVYNKIRSNKEKKLKKLLAERLVAYRKENPSNQIKGELLYTNTTECTNAVLHKFSIYHAYIKNISSFIFTIVLNLGLLALVLSVDNVEWWVLLAVAAIIIYQIFKIVSAPREIERVQRKIYGQGKTREARYAFYEDSFRVSGIQSSSVYPYVQITDIKTSGNYIYLYYGTDNAYILDVAAFSKGDKDSFISFVKSKIL